MQDCRIWLANHVALRTELIGALDAPLGLTAVRPPGEASCASHAPVHNQYTMVNQKIFNYREYTSGPMLGSCS